MIELQGLAKSYGGPPVVTAFDLTVPRGARVAVLGPSGCGKTTLLRLIAGLEYPDEGEVRIGGATLSGRDRVAAPHVRGLGFVFQEPALFPHMTLAGNVAYGLTGTARGDAGRVADILDAVGLTGLSDRRPDELSGGQQRRVALARALAPAPARMLMDEPLSNLDSKARGSLLEVIDALIAASGASLLYVSHDPGEASALGCDVVRMEEGRRVG